MIVKGKIRPCVPAGHFGFALTLLITCGRLITLSSDIAYLRYFAFSQNIA